MLKTGFFVVALDTSIGIGSHSHARWPRLPLVVAIAGASALLTFGAMASRGFHDNGLRLGSELAWRFACFAFFAAAIAGPLCRLMPFALCRTLDALRRQLIWGFCASYGVYLASLLLPNSVGGVLHTEGGAGMTLVILFGGAVTAAMAYAASRQSAALLDDKSRRAFLTVGGSFFWLAYALTGLAHLAGPHRPDAFYGVSLSLMVLVLLLRFGDRFMAKLHGVPDTDTD